jgi:hypothetical protein
MTGGQQAIPLVIPGSGYMANLDLQYSFTGGSASGTITRAEDAPWSAAPLITLDDGGPQNINVDGFSLYCQNLYGGVGLYPDTSSADTNVYNPLGTASGTAAGNGSFWLRIPLETNERDHFGLMGNQDRGTKYNLRDDIGSSAQVFGTAPGTLPSVTINRQYGWYPVPSPVSADGRQQQTVPPTYGIIHYLTAIRSDAAPSPSSTVQHYIRNLSNAVRLFLLQFRAGTGTTPRATAEAAAPTQLDFFVGTDNVWSESYAHRTLVMWNRYRFDKPSGVLAFDALRDFSAIAGYELGDAWLFMGNIAEARFQCVYPSGFSAGGSLTFVTDSLFIPPGVNPFGAVGG